MVETSHSLRSSCPRCKAPLSARTVGRALLDTCWACGGLFLEAPTLVTLLLDGSATDAHALTAAFDGVAARPAPIRMAWCPVCNTPMHDRALVDGSVVRANVCRSHGIWIDAAHVPGAIRILAMRAVGRAGDLERRAFADELRRRRYPAILAHARALAARAGKEALQRSPLGLLASLFG
jgi:Zn-finger nucleic acid-binding protein